MWVLLSARSLSSSARRGCSCACLPFAVWVVHFIRLGCSPARTQRRPASVQPHPGTIPPAVPLQVSNLRSPLAIWTRPPRLGCGCPVWILRPAYARPAQIGLFRTRPGNRTRDPLPGAQRGSIMGPIQPDPRPHGPRPRARLRCA